METRGDTHYVVEAGWYEPGRGHEGETRCDHPDTWYFDTEREAREAFGHIAADLPRAYRVDRETEGRTFGDRGLYVLLKQWEQWEDEDGDRFGELLDQLDERRYGLGEWERDHPEE